MEHYEGDPYFKRPLTLGEAAILFGQKIFSKLKIKRPTEITDTSTVLDPEYISRDPDAHIPENFYTR